MLSGCASPKRRISFRASVAGRSATRSLRLKRMRSLSFNDPQRTQPQVVGTLESVRRTPPARDGEQIGWSPTRSDEVCVCQNVSTGSTTQLIGGGMSAQGWTSPSEAWPRHERPLAQKALSEARLAGWWLKKASARSKVWGVITCGQPTLPGEERCSVSVMCTSGRPDGSSSKKAIDGAVSRCPHDRGSARQEDLLSKAETLVMSAEFCVKAAEALMSAASHRDLLDDYLGQSDTDVAAADALIERALEEERLADEAEQEAGDAAGAAGVPSNLATSNMVEQASHRAGRALKLVENETSRRARVIKARCTEVKARVILLRA
jgi:hypothetical protein